MKHEAAIRSNVTALSVQLLRIATIKDRSESLAAEAYVIFELGGVEGWLVALHGPPIPVHQEFCIWNRNATELNFKSCYKPDIRRHPIRC